MKRPKLPTRKQMLRVLRASERELARHRPLTESQRMINDGMRRMLEATAIASPFARLFENRPIPKNASDTITFRRYVPYAQAETKA